MVLTNFVCYRECNSVPSGGSDVDEDDDAGTMELDGAEAEEELDEVARAKAVAKALAKGSSQVDDVADELRELNMDAYDDEEEGARFSSLITSHPPADFLIVPGVGDC